MRTLWCVGLLLAAACGALLTGSRAERGGLKGDYVEARTASVFAGACHYNGELTTAGREALLAWNITGGGFEDVSLAGVRAVAIVSADANLAETRAERRTELVVDESATEAQAAAFVKAFGGQYASALGRIVSVRRAPVNFRHEGGAYTVSVPHLASLHVEAMPDNACCRMPHLVWYAPLVALEHRKVGYTRMAIYAGGKACDAWQRSGENGAFYGSFSF